MKHITVIFLLFFFWDCSSHPDFEASYYEQTTKIKFPSKYNFVATADNGEFLTITILDLDKAVCKNFVHDNHFNSIDEKHPPYLFGLNFLDSIYKNLPNTKTLLVRKVDKINGKIGWTYLVDTAKCRLYCEIDYPDAGGN